MIGLGRRKRGQPAHRGTSRHVQAVYPFMAQGGLSSRGVYIGRDMHGGSFVFDPWELYAALLLSSPNVMVFGRVGQAKSSLLKTYIYRQCGVFANRRAFVVDPKGEYAPLAAMMGGSVIALRPGGDVRLNPLTTLASTEEQMGLLQAVAAATLKRDLLPDEEAVLRGAVRVVRDAATKEEREPVLPDLVHVLLHPTPDMQGWMVMDERDALAAGRAVAYALDKMCSGELHGMFDGPTSPNLNLDARVVVLDLSAVPDQSLTIVMTCGMSWRRSLLAHKREDDPIRDLTVIDEFWRCASEIRVAEWCQDLFKKSRQYGVANIACMHRVTDLEAAGDQGSRTSALAQGLLSDADTKVVYAQAEDQVERTRDLLGLTDTEAEALRHLRKGRALWKVGNRSFLVQHVLSPTERTIVDTDKRMAVPARRQLERVEL